MGCQGLNKDFPRIITFLRKERCLSQKQALLSHYEKGIRECGLDFLVKTAEYYDVSCDYLLGRTVQRNVATISADDIPDSIETSYVKGNMINQINKKLLFGTTSVIFDMLAQIGSKKLTNAVSNYIMSSEYQIFRRIYSTEAGNSQTIFSVDINRYRNLCSAAMILDLEIIDEIIENEKLTLRLSPDLISIYFDKSATSLFNLIQYSERNIKSVCQGGMIGK